MCKRGYGKLITQIYLKQISSFLQIVVILKSLLLLLKIAVALPDHDSNAWRQNMCIRLKQLIIRFDNSIRPRAINQCTYIGIFVYYWLAIHLYFTQILFTNSTFRILYLACNTKKCIHILESILRCLSSQLVGLCKFKEPVM